MESSPSEASCYFWIMTAAVSYAGSRSKRRFKWRFPSLAKFHGSRHPTTDTHTHLQALVVDAVSKDG